MIRKLKEELIQLSKSILASKEDKNLTGLYDSAKNLYEKLAVLKCIDEELSDVEVDVSKNDIAARFEKLANAVLSGNTAVPESNPHKEDIMVPSMKTIKDMVSEMPSETIWEQTFTEFVEKNDALANGDESWPPVEKSIPSAQPSLQALKSILGSTLRIEPDDKHAFVHHLFDNSVEDYNQVVSQLNTIDTKERSLAFINTMIKPEYNYWKGKEAYEARFIALIQRRFS